MNQNNRGAVDTTLPDKPPALPGVIQLNACGIRNIPDITIILRHSNDDDAVWFLMFLSGVALFTGQLLYKLLLVIHCCIWLL